MNQNNSISNYDDDSNNNNNNSKSISKKGLFGKNKKNKKQNDELTQPLRLSVDESAPMAYNITIGTFEDDGNNKVTPEGEATYT